MNSQQTPPRLCPTCGNDLSEYPYDRLVPGPSGQLARRIGIWLIPIMSLAYLGWLFWGPGPMGFGAGHGYFAAAFITGPSLLLYGLSLVLPGRREVICLRCSWSQEFPRAKRT